MLRVLPVSKIPQDSFLTLPQGDVVFRLVDFDLSSGLYAISPINRPEIYHLYTSRVNFVFSSSLDDMLKYCSIYSKPFDYDE